MFLLSSIIAPKFGLFFWTGLIFLAFFFILRRFAWKPITSALHEREEGIASALENARKAEERLEKIEVEIADMKKAARAEREELMSSASKARDEMIAKAKEEAAAAGAKEREKTRLQIESDKNAALGEIRATAATLAVEIAEKILRKEFENKETQQGYATQLINDLTEN